MPQLVENASPSFVDRRSPYPAVDTPAYERRQFTNSHEELSPDARELATAIDAYIQEHPIKTNIPISWPKEVLYHEDPETVHLTAKKGDMRWLCPCCNNRFFTLKTVKQSKCPYCGMTIEVTSRQKTTTVAK